MDILLTRQIQNGGACLQSAPLSPQHRPPHPPILNLWVYDIQDGRSFGLPQVIRDVKQGNYNFMLLTKTKTKILDLVFCHNPLGYDIF